jgi:hypothetical protein
MALSGAFQQMGLPPHLGGRLIVGLVLLLSGFLLLPGLIYGGGLWLLGRYEGAGLGATYGAVFSGLARGSAASWIVVLGPLGLWLLYQGLRLWWRVSASLARERLS